MAERWFNAVKQERTEEKPWGWLRIIPGQRPAETAESRGLTRVGIRRGLGEFLDDILCELATFTAV